MSNITIVEAPANINPSDPTSYFSEESGLVKCTKARTKVPGMHCLVIPDGTRVAALVKVSTSRVTGLPLMQVTNGVCDADSFELSEGGNQLSSYVGSMVAVAFTIGERTGDHACHGSSYTVHSVTLATLPLNPSAGERNFMRPGTSFLVEGQFVGYYEKARGCIVIATSAGEKVTLDSSRLPTYEGGVLEKLDGKPMIPGETIRILAFMSKKNDWDELPAGVATVGYNKPYLLKPDTQRLADYEDLRLRVAVATDAMRDQIAAQQWGRARNTFAELRKLELTRHEDHVAVEIMEGVPTEQRSVYCDRKYVASDIEWVFGIDPESLNQDDFLVYAREIMLGIRAHPTDNSRRAGQMDLLKFWQSPHSILAVESLVELLRETVPTRLSRLEQCSDEHDAYGDDYLLLAECIHYVGRWGQKDVHENKDVDPSLVRAIIDVVERCISEGYYRTDREVGTSQVPKRLSDVLGKCLRSLAEAYMYQPIVRQMVTPALVKGWCAHLEEAGADLSVISELRRNVPWR